MHSIAIFGGTFDPIHIGHLKTSLTIQAYFKFDSYVILPCKIPVTKAPARATQEQRIKMIELAIKKFSFFKVDSRELERDSPSYMVDTLESFRLDFPQAAITLIIGYDAFHSLMHWHQWEKLITLANILVINRNEFAQQELSEPMHNFLKTYQSEDKTAILKERSGTIFLFDAGDYTISSTKIRESIKQNIDVSHMLPPEEYQYIKNEGLYLS